LSVPVTSAFDVVEPVLDGAQWSSIGSLYEMRGSVYRMDLTGGS